MPCTHAYSDVNGEGMGPHYRVQEYRTDACAGPSESPARPITHTHTDTDTPTANPPQIVQQPLNLHGFSEGPLHWLPQTLVRLWHEVHACMRMHPKMLGRTRHSNSPRVTGVVSTFVTLCLMTFVSYVRNGA